MNPQLNGVDILRAAEDATRVIMAAVDCERGHWHRAMDAAAKSEHHRVRAAWWNGFTTVAAGYCITHGASWAAAHAAAREWGLMTVQVVLVVFGVVLLPSALVLRRRLLRDSAYTSSRNHSLPARRHRAGGFTIVELLMVIGVISILVGLVVGGVQRSRDAARALVCVANQRSCAQLVAAYVNEQRAVPFGNENIAGGDLLWANAGGEISGTLEDAHPVFTCPVQRTEWPETRWVYYAGRMLTDYQSGQPWGDLAGGDPRPELLWPVTRHYEEHAREWLWCEYWPLHAGRRTATRADGSGEQAAGGRRMDDPPMEAP